MRSINMLTEDPILDYDKIAAAKYGDRAARLLRLRSTVFARYARYSEFETMDPITTFSKEEANDLAHCYNSPTQPLDALKARLIRANQQYPLCPYCGVSKAAQFDHYVPKEKFPEFSVCHLNLVRGCGACNTHKSDVWDSSNRQVIHFYLDSLPTSQWLFATVAMSESPLLTYSLEIPSDMPQGMARLLRAHYERLHLLQLYSEQTADLLSNIEDWTGQAVRPAAIAEELNRVSAKRQRRYGRNHYEAVGLSALAQSQAALEWMATSREAQGV